MARGAIIRGTAEELANSATGYTASGESQFSRRAASAPLHDERSQRPVWKNVPRDQQIARTAKRVAKLKCDISLETDKNRRAKLEKDFELKSALLERLRAEQ
jgi:hypothetical protein